MEVVTFAFVICDILFSLGKYEQTTNFQQMHRCNTDTVYKSKDWIAEEVLFSEPEQPSGCPTVQCPTALPSPVRVSMSLLWTHLKFECLWVKLQNLEYWYIFTIYCIYMIIVRFQNLKHMTDRQWQRGPWAMRSFSDAQTLPDRTEEQCVIYGLDQHLPHRRDLSWAHQGQARPVAVVVRGEGDLWGRGGYRHLCSSLSRTTPITEQHALRLEV